MQQERPVMGSPVLSSEDLHTWNSHPATHREWQTHSELSEPDQRLRHIQKMEVVGKFAGGIAHDLNNILTVIVGSSQLLLDHPEVGQSAGQRVQQILDAGFRAANLTSQLLSFSRKQTPRRMIVNLNRIIADSTNMIRFLIGNRIELTTMLAADLLNISADPVQMEQVLINLCVNARDAMALGGSIFIESENVEVRQAEMAGDGFAMKPGRYVRVSVSDTGIGMDENVRSRLFEPFFTTKGIGEGTGLGLAMAYGIIKNHDGFIDVDSERGRGTTFRLYLPLQDSDRPELRVAPDSNGKQVDNPQKTHGTVLLVEDEENMVHLVQDLLEHNGYRVLPAFDGAQAIGLYQDHHDEIDLVLLDLGLPKVAGWDVIQKIQQQNPKVSILVASGYIEPEIKSRMDAAGVKRFLYKPYLPDDVVRTVHELLLNR